MRQCSPGNEPENMSRRRFLTASVAAAGIAALPERIHAQETVQTQTINTYLKIIETMGNNGELPGIAQAKLYDEKDAQYGVIQVEQSHWVHDLTASQWQEVQLCQMEIGDFLRFAQKDTRININHVLLEGLEKPFTEWRQFGVTNPHEILARPDLMGYWGAPRVLSHTHNLDVQTAEDPILHHRMMLEIGLRPRRTPAEMQQYTREQFHKLMFTDRENAVLQKVKNRTDYWQKHYGKLTPNNRTGLTVYGADHNFRDNIIKMHKATKDRYAYLRLTPKTVLDARIKREGPQLALVPPGN